LAERLSSLRETCFIVSPGEAYKRSEQGHFWIDPTNAADLKQLLQDTLNPTNPACRGVVHLWSLEAAGPTEETTGYPQGAMSPPDSLPLQLQAARDLGTASVLLLLQELHDKSGSYTGLRESPRLWLVTRGAQAVGMDPVSIA